MEDQSQCFLSESANARDFFALTHLKMALMLKLLVGAWGFEPQTLPGQGSARRWANFSYQQALNFLGKIRTACTASTLSTE